MRNSVIFLSSICFLAGCSSSSSGGGDPVLAGWGVSKASQTPSTPLSSEYEAPTRQALSTLAWEDGVYITRDGLTLFAQYIPIDLFKGTVLDAQQNPNLFPYKRGPDLGQDFTAPFGITTEWMHSDLVYSTRSSTSQTFPAWNLSSVRKLLFNDAAPQGILNSINANLFDIFLYTDEDTNPSFFATKIRILRNVSRTPTGPGSLLLSSVISPDQYYDENPHVERFNNSDANQLVLFFDSKNRNSSLDLFYTTSTDNGVTWSAVQAVTSVNTSATEHQPHLYFDGSIWWLYVSATNTSDGKLAIYRFQQGTVGNWNSWQNKELVVSAGTAVGVGEPTLTSSGDLSFVTITENTVNPSSTDQYDSDAWFMKKK